MDKLQFDLNHGFASRRPPIRLSDEQVKSIYQVRDYEDYSIPPVSRIAFVVAMALLGLGWFLIANADSLLP